MKKTRMTKMQRIRAAIDGQPVDTIPYSIWTHLPGIDLNPHENAEETYRFFKKYDVDILKTMNNGMYSIEDFGCEIDYSQIRTGGVAKLINTPISSAEDWLKLKPASIDQGALRRELVYLSLLIEKMKGENTPIILTVFSPITTAMKLSNNHLFDHISAGYKKAVQYGLEVISQTTCAFVAEAIRIGADGIFFASQTSTYDITTEVLYKEFGMPYDLQVLSSASKGWCNVLHAHGENIMFTLLMDYPVHVFNWHAWETLPDIDEASSLTRKCLMGGINRMDITNGQKNEILHQIYRTIQLTQGKKLILTPGCVIRYPLNEDILAYIKEIKLKIEQVLL